MIEFELVFVGGAVAVAIGVAVGLIIREFVLVSLLAGAVPHDDKTIEIVNRHKKLKIFRIPVLLKIQISMPASRGSPPAVD
jgi:hypothetical protein